MFQRLVRAKFTVLFVISCLQFHIDAFHYEAPEDCEWRVIDSETKDVSLECKLRTINSDFDSTNFSVIQARYTAKLRISCNDVLFFQSTLSNRSFDNLIDLQELNIQYCKISEVPLAAFQGLYRLKNLTLHTHNTDWSAMTLKFQPNSLSTIPKAERLDFSMNNIWSLPGPLFCSLQKLKFLNISKIA